MEKDPLPTLLKAETPVSIISSSPVSRGNLYPPISQPVNATPGRLVLANHPQHHFGGTPLNLFTVLQKPTSPSKSPPYTQTLIHGVPCHSIFAGNDRLKWFPIVAHRLGIHLHLVPGVPLVGRDSFSITLDWQRNEVYRKGDLSPHLTSRRRRMECMKGPWMRFRIWRESIDHSARLTIGRIVRRRRLRDLWCSLTEAVDWTSRVIRFFGR